MDGGEEVGLVLARATELLSKINRCIFVRGPQRRHKDDDSGGPPSWGAERAGASRGREDGDDTEDEEEEEEEAAGLLDIRDALESLEQELSSLQALEQQQRYAREAMLAQIDQCRRFLISKIKEYKGEGSDVIEETLNFAGGNVDHNEDLMLPPYSNHIPDLFILDDLYSSSHLISKRRFYQNGLATKCITKTMDESRTEPDNPLTGNILKGVKFTLGLIIKSAFTFASVMSILKLAGFQPTLRRRDSEFRWFDLFVRRDKVEERVPNRCSPGKVLVMEDGEHRFVVKERVEIPFDPVGPAPNVSYGLG